MWLKKKKEELQINLTPLIDVVFLLLIFFMVSTSFKKENKLSLNLPEASGDILESEAKAVEISVAESGEIFINGQGLLNLQIETIKDALSTTGAEPSTQIILSADAKAPYQAVVKVMDAAGQLGLSNLTLATQQPDESN